MESVKLHAFFADCQTKICWESLTTEHGNVPFVPDIASAVDVSYFSPDRRRNMGQVQEPETPLHRKVDHTGRFENFTFTVGERHKRGQSIGAANHGGASRK